MTTAPDRAVLSRGTQPDDAVRHRGGTWVPRLRRFVVQRVLQLDDTPHRIAFGVFLGFVVGASPTLGFQMLIYVTLATLVGANRLSGLGPVWISNPLTAVPLYYGNWMLGHVLLRGSAADAADGRNRIEALFTSAGELGGLWQRMFEAQFWHQSIDVFFAVGAELWVGSLVVGLGAGGIAYGVTLRAVVAYRRARAAAGEG